ncbi:response regulator transcription factor [Marinobacterium sp. LSUCC0821]|jgi:two-component system OmpR family response regulator|uniref:winged helix-turn-helix domain-containing protein n=1 Tax=Marinobacterium sp. LSUCC0821 TaxID=2668067 RepID=UPI001451EFFD|nr:response regulator transcription factor [Marinobacterium sp. LSUCC0821]QJD70791.1 response regulator transcription factor [Marinobacterium sp. LSUCC0821]
MRILLVEDETGLANALSEHLELQGMAVDAFDQLRQAELAIRTTEYDIVLLDLQLVDGDAIPWLKKRRQVGLVTPVIVLTARDQISDRIAGLDAGADDYVIKPYDLDEVSARIQAVTRRGAGLATNAVTYGRVTADLQKRSLEIDGELIDLTAREWSILETLIKRPGHVVSKEQIEDRLYAFGHEVESNTVEVYISRLRKKMGKDLIKTARGLGYRLEAE